MTREPSSKVAELRDRLKALLEPEFGRGWIAKLAERSEVNEDTIRTLFSRGQRLDARVMTQLEEAAGIQRVQTARGEQIVVAADPAPLAEAITLLRRWYDAEGGQAEWFDLLLAVRFGAYNGLARRRRLTREDAKAMREISRRWITGDVPGVTATDRPQDRPAKKPTPQPAKKTTA